MVGRPNLFDAYYKKLEKVGDYIELPKKCTTSQACSSAYQFRKNRMRNTKGIDISVQKRKDGSYIAKMLGFLEPTRIKNTDFYEINKSEFSKTGLIGKDNIIRYGTVSFNFNPDYDVFFELNSKDGIFIFDKIRAINHYEEILDEHMEIDQELKEKIIHKLFAE
ncbi:MAG: hypothetical protein [Bacteriophage sp.]|nr:MAG: hypothetical protein [Bacteriophage sp.]